MQQHPNNDPYNFPSEKGKGIAGTIIIHLIALGICILIGFSVPPPPEYEEGIIVNFGTDETGLGLIEPSPPASQEETSPPPSSEPEVVTDEEPLLTQDNEEAPEVKKVDPEAEKRRMEQLEAERIRKEQEEAERIRKEQEEAERKRIEAEHQRQAEITDRTRKALEDSKNRGTSTVSEGIAGGEGNQGVPSGSVDSQNRGEGGGTGDSGLSRDLAERGCEELPKPDYYDYQEGGQVVVEVYVNRSGIVTRAISGYKGTNIPDKNLWKAAEEAALKAKFEKKQDAPDIQKGTITYHFKLR